MKVEYDPPTPDFRIKNCKINLFVIMSDLVVSSNVDGFIHFEVFDIQMEDQLLLRGSLTVDLGGLTIPVSICCHEDCFGSYYVFASYFLGTVGFVGWVIFI